MGKFASKTNILSLASKDLQFRRSLIAALKFQLSDRDSNDVEQSMASIYAEIRNMKPKVRPMGRFVNQSLKQLEEDWSNLNAILEQHLYNGY